MKNDRSIRNSALSRRGFLKSAVVGSAAIAAAPPLAAAGHTNGNEKIVAPKDPLEELVERFGSEFGDLRKAQ